MITFSLAVFVLIAILWFLGWYAKRWVVTEADYLLAGRQVGLMAGVAGICGIAFAGSMTSIVPGLTIQYGFMGWILGGSLPLIIGYILYGVFACPYIRRCGAYTLPEWLEMRFDTRTRLVVSLASLLGITGIVAMNIVAMALIMTGFLGGPLWVMITLVLFGHLMFILLGGFWALTLTDVVQVLLGFVLLPALALYCVATFGGWSLIQEHFVTSSPLSHGTLGSFPWLQVSYPSVLTIFLLLGIFIQWGGNYYWLRAAAARSEAVSRWQFILGGLLVVIIHGTMGIFGLYAGSLYREAFLNQANPMGAYGMLMRDLPASIALFGLIAALAATISTTSNAHMGITATLVRDIYQRLWHPEATRTEVLRASRFLTLLTGVAIWSLCFYPGGPYFLLAVSCAMLGPAALVFLLGHRWPGLTATGAFWGTLASMAVMLLYEGLTLSKIVTWPVHTVVIGTMVTLPVIIGLSLWTRTKERLSVTPVAQLSVQADHRCVLDLMRQGYTTMVELSDFLAMDSAQSGRLVADLERAGLLQRRSSRGPDFFTFTLTPAGEKLARETTSAEPTSASQGLDSLSLQILAHVAETRSTLQELSRATGASAATLGVIVNRLDRLGYLRDGGLWQRKIGLSEKGRTILANDRHTTPKSGNKHDQQRLINANDQTR
jgi:SSS family solute:Na+ symporter